MILSLIFKTRIKKDDTPIALNWAKTATGKFQRLIMVNENDPSLVDQSGVYVVWSKRGAKVTWLCVGAANNLARVIKAAKDDSDILAYNEKGAIGVTWAHSNPKYRDRIATYLRLLLKPAVNKSELYEATNFSAEPFPVYPPIL